MKERGSNPIAATCFEKKPHNGKIGVKNPIAEESPIDREILNEVQLQLGKLTT